MLDDRKTAILAAVVQEYIATAQPVGSANVARTPSIQVSPATVRSELAVLEQEGYLVQPHTSAGRIPTDKGYRFFVDHLAMPGRLDRTTQLQVGRRSWWYLPMGLSNTSALTYSMATTMHAF